ncbi:hypothetical protein [Nitrosomonas sp. Nm166]|uniref:hypothetical protein n=1 Tax=Nitrosomonas sp. Nm166 TaxID=1881054 RepID=UPI0008E71F54|nr:hypothetical protein [Nitrosomonas sp. Nm166]SFF13823.1 hypothetical protein SAMN05428977_105423 [Nitrosomonas sp. Nm166]
MLESLLAPAAATITNCRLLVSFDSEGKMHIMPVPPDASVLSKRDMLEAINKGLVLDTDTLAEFAMATIKNLQHRCKPYRKAVTVEI